MKRLLLLVVVACGPKPAPSGAGQGDAIVYVKSNVGDAQVYFDGRFVGSVSILRGGVALDPGKHRVELRHDDYFSRYVELDLHRAEHKQLELQLAPVLP